MKKFLCMLITAGALILNTENGIAYRGRPGPPPGMGPRHHGPFFGDVERMKEMLNLSDGQVKRIRNINARFRKESRSWDEKLRPQLNTLRSLLMKEKYSIPAVRAQLRKISDIEIELKILQIRHRRELRNILTPAQRQELRREMREMRRRHHHRRGGRGRGWRKHRFND